MAARRKEQRGKENALVLAGPSFFPTLPFTPSPTGEPPLTLAPHPPILPNSFRPPVVAAAASSFLSFSLAAPPAGFRPTPAPLVKDTLRRMSFSV